METFNKERRKLQKMKKIYIELPKYTDIIIPINKKEIVEEILFSTNRLKVLIQPFTTDNVQNFSHVIHSEQKEHKKQETEMAVKPTPKVLNFNLQHRNIMK